MSLKILSIPPLILTGLLIIVTGCGEKTGQIKPVEKVVVETVEVMQKEVAIPVHSSGKLSAKVEMKLS